MPQLIKCDYCGQQNGIEANCCEFCGAPVIMTELKVRTSHFLPEGSSFFQVSGSSSVMDYPEASELSTTAALLPKDRYGRETIFYDDDESDFHTPDPPKKGWREWLGIGDK